MKKLSYKSSGVDIGKGDLISKSAFESLKKTLKRDSLIFNNLVAIKANFTDYKNPYLAFAADGVGTKLTYVFKNQDARSVGIDVVAMCVNDLVRNNIKPLGFALYRATGKINERVMQQVVDGVTSACLQSDCVYVTGESAEMPDFYQKDEFDLAGFAVGVFDEKDLILSKNISEGDVVIGLASSGIHSNGFSLVRKIFPPEKIKRNPKIYSQIVAPTKLYVKSVLQTNQKFRIQGWAHITGSGLFGKLGKIIPDNLVAELKIGSWEIPEIFSELQSRGKLTNSEMFATFNMGIGFAGIVAAKDSDRVVEFLKMKGEQASIIGSIVKKTNKVKVSLTN